MRGRIDHYACREDTEYFRKNPKSTIYVRGQLDSETYFPERLMVMVERVPAWRDEFYYHVVQSAASTNGFVVERWAIAMLGPPEEEEKFHTRAWVILGTEKYELGLKIWRAMNAFDHLDMLYCIWEELHPGFCRALDISGAPFASMEDIVKFMKATGRIR